MGVKSKAGLDFTEQRNGMRAIREVALRYRLIKSGRKKIDSSWSRSHSRNMSVSGLLFISSMPFKIGDTLELEILLSGMIEIYKGLAEVVRTRKIADDEYEVALKYMDDKQKTRPARRHV